MARKEVAPPPSSWVAQAELLLALTKLDTAYGDLYRQHLANRERKLLALAGGDVRYGGVQDLVAVVTQYDSDRLLARFAIVDRCRIQAW